MNKSGSLIAQLFSIRNQYGKNFSTRKLNLLDTLARAPVKSKKALQSYNDTLLFLIAYPDNRAVYRLASQSLHQLQLYIQSHSAIKERLYNTGITNTLVCAAFSFEIVKWLRSKHPKDIQIYSFESNDIQIRSILSVVMPKVESEILQDANATWRSWLKQTSKREDDMLDRLIAVFDETDMRPETRDEFWNAIGINVEISLPSHHGLHGSLITPYCHRSLIKKKFIQQQPDVKPATVDVDEIEAEYIIECSRMIMVRHLREIDPITFTAPRLVSYYRLDRGISVALMGMVPERRHPIDSYMGYAVFKNGLPVAYGGSWILFDSGRIGLNVFPAYRGGESQYIFQQVLKLHSKIYRLNRFSVDPYQIGKQNSDGIHSGSFWVYYHAGFRPIREQQQHLAEAEALKIKAIKGYRSAGSVLAKLAESRLELILQKKPVRFDATDVSLAYARILKDQYNNNRKLAEERSFTKLARLLQLKNYHEEKLQFILKNWCVLLLSNEQELRRNPGLKKKLKKLVELKAEGAEEDYITELQAARELRKFLEGIVII
ncbi:MAG: hypothetical protein ABIN97_17220 [Ginsengibacter sp.]